MAVRDALAKSDNDAAIRIFRDAGAANVAAWARALGIESKLGADNNTPLGGGGVKVKPIEMANGFAVFASGGEVATPVLISKISRGGTALELPAHPPARRAMEEAEAYLVTSLMRSVVTSGTGRRALALGRPVAGKTGTTDFAVDTWFVGYSTDYVCAVWVGYDDNLELGPQESGAATALPVWVSFMKAAHEGRPVTEFVRPSTIVTARIDHATGLLPRDEDTAIEEEFLDGTVPTETAPLAADAGAPAATGASAPVPAPSPPPPPTMPEHAPIDDTPPF
jgi:penicillin-binding protein 1A